MNRGRSALKVDENQFITDEVQKISESRLLGRSRAYGRLLDYLVRCSIESRRPKELEIAAEVFDKDGDFDPNQDSLVRVYMHNLRQKLDNYYATAPDANGFRLEIPKGEYRLAVVSAALPPPGSTRAGPPPVWLAVAVGLLAINLVVLIGTREASPEPTVYEQAAQSPVWTEILDDDLPLLLVVGDYYIFGELDESGYVERLVRNFDVNSSEDLDNLFVYEPELQERYLDLDLTYLPQGSAFALKDVLRVIYTSDKPVRVTPMSGLTVADLKSHHIVYVGYISALGTLMDFVFASSGLEVGDSYDELTNIDTGEYYASSAGIPVEGQRNYHDYGLISTFPGPEGNHFLIIAGTRDSGVMHTAQTVTSPEDLAALATEVETDSVDGPVAFEALYEVTGFDRMSLDATLVHTSPLGYQRIWGGARTVQ